MTPTRTPEGKWIIFEVSMGTQLERWPVDAKMLLIAGTHTAQAPEGVEPKVPPAPPTHVGVPKAPTVSIPEAEEKPVKKAKSKPEAE